METIKLERRELYDIFNKKYEKIAGVIDEFFVDETGIKDKHLLRDLRIFKEMIINTIDDIHKDILTKSLQLEFGGKTKEDTEKKNNEKKNKGGFWN
jgi:hypothetical protein